MRCLRVTRHFCVLGSMSTFNLQKRVTRHSFSSTVCIQKRVTACVLGSRRSVFMQWWTEQLHSILGLAGIWKPWRMMSTADDWVGARVVHILYCQTSGCSIKGRPYPGPGPGASFPSGPEWDSQASPRQDGPSTGVSPFSSGKKLFWNS